MRVKIIILMGLLSLIIFGYMRWKCIIIFNWEMVFAEEFLLMPDGRTDIVPMLYSECKFNPKFYIK